MASTTSVPGVLDALVALCENAPGLGADGVQVIDGQPLVAQDPDLVVVGWSPVRPTTEINQTRQNASATRDQETYDVPVLLSSERGDPDMRLVRANVEEMVNACNTALSADRRLGGACLMAQISQVTWEQAATEGGVAATAEVLITVTAMTKR
ncbi:hypothetical protein [Nocardiopsis sp. FR26]|uniref:hypothetical protein n=1 Tax=Nocardiopsis sp. FR26 TaxID=2605987 RepID=UPI001F2C722E|nr:hypothetical protein [Nocardiopsis sp. FR26]